ncbi:helix-turn-helix domain-containing protein [Streptomyces sp. NPDC101225]|uniref:transcriptional regulator n=1 Tax=Streptomyces sp. NPDC101225 TaxID=3366135 RepID=UPI0038243E0E
METRDDVEEFAALLRRLKARTDRSYGSLARRLGMNTSTLHRYCAGEAVPQDFAPVERLAAFCAATADERLELHRRWLLAVAARRRPRTTDTTTDVAADRAPTSGTANAGPESEGASPTDEGPEGGRTSPTDTEPQSNATSPQNAAPDINDTSPADGTPGAADTSPTDTEPQSNATSPQNAASSANGASPADATPGADDVSSVDVERPVPAARPWYRRRRVLASAAVACALLATIGGLSALSKGRSSEAAGPRSSARPGTSAPAAPHGSSKPKPSASPSPAGAPGASASGTGKKTAGRSAGPGQDPTGAGRPVTAVPLAWHADSQVWQNGCGHDYVVDKTPAQVPPPPVQQDAGTWAATQGAVHGRQTMVQISVQGRSSTAVVLEALRVRVVSRGTPAAGSAYAMDQGCGGELTPRSFTVNLDADRPVARPKDGADSRHTLPAVHFPYRVSAEDPEVLLVDATTQTYDARWYLELDWSCQGSSGTLRIDDHGRPFRTSGIKGMPRYWYGTNGSGERAWVPYDS